MFSAYVSQTSGDFPSEMWSRAHASLAASQHLATLFASDFLFLKVKAKTKVAQLCPTLCDPVAYIVHGTP